MQSGKVVHQGFAFSASQEPPFGLSLSKPLPTRPPAQRQAIEISNGIGLRMVLATGE